MLTFSSMFRIYRKEGTTSKLNKEHVDKCKLYLNLWYGNSQIKVMSLMSVTKSIEIGEREQRGMYSEQRYKTTEKSTLAMMTL